MSMHNIPPTPLQESGLIAHRLPVGTPSQLSDAFRLGVQWAVDHMQPIKLPELYMNADDPQTMAYNDACVECANTIVEAGYKVVAS